MPTERTTTTDNWLDDPYPSRAFQRVREFAPSARIANDSGVVSELPVDLQDLGGIELKAVDGSTTTVERQFATSNGEGLVVLKDGVIVYEQYANGMQPRTPHLCMSVTKSFVGAMLGIQVGKGLIAMDQLVTEIAPQFIGTSLDGANVRHLIDMTAGTEFGRPAASASRRAMFRPCAPSGMAQPMITSSTCSGERLPPARRSTS